MQPTLSGTSTSARSITNDLSFDVQVMNPVDAFSQRDEACRAEQGRCDCNSGADVRVSSEWPALITSREQLEGQTQAHADMHVYACSLHARRHGMIGSIVVNTAAFMKA